MAGRDRLAAMRAQQAGNRYADNNSPQPATGGYDRRANNPYAQQDENRYELTQFNGQNNGQPRNGGGDDLTAFYDEISAIQDSISQFNSNVQRVSDLHSRSLNTMDDQAAAENNRQLDSLVEETRALSSEIKARIKDLVDKSSGTRDANARFQQINSIKQRFMEAIQMYQKVESQNRTKYKQRMERQFRIVKPDATAEEVKAVVDDEQGGQIFSQALMSSTTYGQSRAAYREVQERHEDIKRIERTLTELTQLFNDMSVLVDRQEDQINRVHDTTGSAKDDVEQGLNHAEKAVVSARAARKKRWICFGILVVICAIIAIVLAVHFTNGSSKKST